MWLVALLLFGVWPFWKDDGWVVFVIVSIIIHFTLGLVSEIISSSHGTLYLSFFLVISYTAVFDCCVRYHIVITCLHFKSMDSKSILSRMGRFLLTLRTPIFSFAFIYGHRPKWFNNSDQCLGHRSSLEKMSLYI